MLNFSMDEIHYYYFCHLFLLYLLLSFFCNIIIIFLQYLYIVYVNIYIQYICIDSKNSLSSTDSNFNQDVLSTNMLIFVIAFIVAINSVVVKFFIFGLSIFTIVYHQV